MKKFIVLCLAGVLIFALGATVYAQAPKLEFRASGFIDVQTFIGQGVPQYNSNVGGHYGVVNGNYSGATAVIPYTGFGAGSKGWNTTQSGWESRAHLKFDAIMGPNLSGTIFFEIDTFRGGAQWQPTLGGGSNGREANSFGGWSTDRVSVEVKNIYIDVGLPYFGIPVPMTARVGAQTFVVRPGMLLANDGFGVMGAIKIDPVQIIPMYGKILENLDFAADDADMYGLHVNAKLGTFTVGGYGLWYNMNTYPLWILNPAIPGVSPTGTQQATMYWLGLYTDGKAGPLNLNFDFVYDFGKVERKFGQGWPKVDYQGWATRGKIEYPWEKFAFGFVGMYATGDDATQTSPTGIPGTTTSRNNLSHHARGYVVPPASEQGPANGESMVVYSMEPGATGGYGIANTANYAQMHRGGFGGTWFAKLYGNAKLTPWYKVTLQTLYIGDTTRHGSTFGNALKYPGQVVAAPAAPRYLKNNSSIGWEFDIMQEFMIYNNLRFFVGWGYLLAGGALDLQQGTQPYNIKAQNPWAFRTRLQYTF